MVHENIAGIRVIQAYVQEENELNRFKKLNEQLINKNLELTKISGAFFPLMVFTTGLATALVLWIGGREVIRWELTLGSYVAFNGYLAMLTWPMAAIGFMINLSQRGIASMRRIEEIMNVKPEIYDEPCIDRGQSPLPLRKRDRVRGEFKSGIEIKSLTFSYTSKKNTLSNINLRLKAGSSLSLAGAVGSGKSTLVKLIMRI